MTRIYPVILCGGDGTRLWPVSRKGYPKQFCPLLDSETLFQSTVRRLAGAAGEVTFDRPTVVTNARFRFVVTEQLAAIEQDPLAIMLEPEGRNTAPAVLAAALHLYGKDPDSILLVAPSDHLLPDHDLFHAAVAQGLEAIENGQFVLFGIRPDRPETGYGYLELADPCGPHLFALKSFVEKPNSDDAMAMMQAQRFLWNAGIFLFRARDMIAAFQTFAPSIIPPVEAALEQAELDLGFLRLHPSSWADSPNISIDYAVMEKANNLAVVPYTGVWSDLGGWDAVWRTLDQDSSHNVIQAGATAIDCENSLLRSDSDRVALVGIGLKDIIAVAMNDAVLVAHRDHVQDVKNAVALLKSKKVAQAEQFPIDHRPWGWFESLMVGERFQVKLIHVLPGALLSLQSHFHRSEHWVVIKGTARVTLDDTTRLITENESIYIPMGAVHRLENVGRIPMELIEVQTGSYVGEDDIVRYEDLYARSGKSPF